jgi:hypothetical protein
MASSVERAAELNPWNTASGLVLTPNLHVPFFTRNNCAILRTRQKFFGVMLILKVGC